MPDNRHHGCELTWHVRPRPGVRGPGKTDAVVGVGFWTFGPITRPS